MKTPKLLKVVKRYLSADRAKQYEHTKCFTDVLKKLKKKENDLKNKLKQESNEKFQKEIKKQIAIVHAQRKKGIEAVKKLKKKK
jgi:bisphosphoglycerate-independent phosphoglycerate mutase (AlkP superfamily)